LRGRVAPEHTERRSERVRDPVRLAVVSGVMWEELYSALRRAKGDSESDVEPADADEHPCTACGRTIGSRGRWHSDGLGELIPFCGSCADSGAAHA
jgi:hypothetical protein